MSKQTNGKDQVPVADSTRNSELNGALGAGRIMTEIGCFCVLFGQPCNPVDVARNLDLPLTLVENEFVRLADAGHIKWADAPNMLDGWIPTT